MSSSFSNCCQTLYTYPVSREKGLIIGGGILGVLLVGIIIIIIICSSGDSGSDFKGSDTLKKIPLIISQNEFANELQIRLNNKINGFNFTNLDSNGGEWKSCKTCRTDIQRLKSGLVSNQIWTLTTNCSSAYKDAVSLIIEEIDVIKRLLADNSIKLVYNSKGVTESFKKSSLSSLLAIKGGHTFDSRLGVLRTFYDLGIRCLSLVTSACAKATPSSPPWYVKDKEEKKEKTLNGFGLKIVEEMNRLGMIIDISELSEDAQKTVITKSSAPVIISNANSHEKCQTAGNVKDDVLKTLKEKDGLIMVSFDPSLVAVKDKVTLTDVIVQLDYLKGVVGASNIGIAAGFDGFSGTIKDLEDSSKYPNLFDALHKKNESMKHTAWSKEELEGLAGLNFLRVFAKVEETATKLQASTKVVEEYEDHKDFKEYSCYSDWHKKSSE